MTADEIPFPETDEQFEDVLRFFLGPAHGITDPDDRAEKVEELLDGEQGWMWFSHKAREPITERQRRRLQWAAKRLNLPLPQRLTKVTASKLITEWFEKSNPGLEAEWSEQKERRERLETREPLDFDNVNEWREIYHCRRVPEKEFEEVYYAIDGRHEGEAINNFMDRFFGELCRRNPFLFERPDQILRPAPPLIPPPRIVEPLLAQTPKRTHPLATLLKCVGVLIVIVPVFAIIVYSINNPPGETAVAQQPPKKIGEDQGLIINMDPAARAASDKVIQAALDTKLLMKIQWSRMPQVSVGLGFYALSFDYKKSVAQCIWAKAKIDHPSELVAVSLIDGYSGKEIGIYPDGWTGTLKIY